MADTELSLPERALLLILMAEQGELCNADIRERYGPGLVLTGRHRQRLLDAQFIACRKGPRDAFYFSLADSGWSWCRRELSRPAPEHPGPAGHALYAVLGGLERYLSRTGRGLADVFGDAPAAGDLPAPAADEIEQAVRRSYRRLADPQGGWIALADVREQLGDIPKRDVDGVLRLMTRMPGVRIEERPDGCDPAARDRAAAVRIAGRDRHLLAIAPAPHGV